MRKKIPEEEKKTTVSVSMHPKLLELLEKYSIENNTNKSKVIDELLKNMQNNSNNSAYNLTVQQ